VTFVHDPDPIIEYSFDLDVGCDGEVFGMPGETVEIPVWATLSAPGPIVRLIDQSILVASPDGAEFCIDVPTTEDCGVPCKEELAGQRFGRGISFVIQNAENGCADGSGDPEDPSNAGRRGLIDVGSFLKDELFFGGTARTMPILLTVVVPDDGDGLSTLTGYERSGNPQRRRLPSAAKLSISEIRMRDTRSLLRRARLE